jgi:uncharacterized protein (TIGR02145 family)
MKKNLLLMMMCCPMVLAAQNGVTVSGLAIDAGTVTFNVSWQTPMPVALWSDSVWVFVDYNNAGKMERLPLSPGATLTTTSPGGKVIEEPDNNKGVWVAGNARSAGSFSAMVKLLTEVKNVAGACAYASNYPPMGYIATNVITFTGTAPYTVMLEGVPEPQTAGSHYMVGGTIASFTDKTGAPGRIIPGQPQGSCTYTAPAVVGTFAAFPNNYDGGTYVSLVDERDNKIYPVVKVGGRWMMALNLNYQKGLIWQSEVTEPSSGVAFDPALIGHFWCPGGYSSTATISTRESCDVWGALYSWETAMSFDGRGSWTENNVYNTGAANAENSNFNHGRTASGSGTGGRGICPPNWHVPTDNEWAIISDGMESNGGTAHQNASERGWYGQDAGSRGKAKCTVADNGSTGDMYVNDTQANWYYYSLGTDIFGFRVLPSGLRSRIIDGAYESRGVNAYFWTSTAESDTWAFARQFVFVLPLVGRGPIDRALGLSVRCIRD